MSNTIQELGPLIFEVVEGFYFSVPPQVIFRPMGCDKGIGIDSNVKRIGNFKKHLKKCWTKCVEFVHKDRIGYEIVVESPNINADMLENNGFEHKNKTFIKYIHGSMVRDLKYLLQHHIAYKWDKMLGSDLTLPLPLDVCNHIMTFSDNSKPCFLTDQQL